MKTAVAAFIAPVILAPEIAGAVAPGGAQTGQHCRAPNATGDASGTDCAASSIFQPQGGPCSRAPVSRAPVSRAPVPMEGWPKFAASLYWLEICQCAAS
jgi:hypothetical protein